MAHVRRKFVDVFKSQGSHITEQALQRIAQLYAVEKAALGSPPVRRMEIRQTKASSILDDLESWLQSELPKLSGEIRKDGLPTHSAGSLTSKSTGLMRCYRGIIRNDWTLKENQTLQILLNHITSMPENLFVFERFAIFRCRANQTRYPGPIPCQCFKLIG